jgi:hypothetical protein
MTYICAKLVSAAHVIDSLSHIEYLFLFLCSLFENHVLE